jgi:hypothetical protein
MNFSAWHRMSFTQLVKREAGEYIRISNDIHDVVGQEGIPHEIPRMHHDGDQRQKCTWLEQLHTSVAMPCS